MAEYDITCFLLHVFNDVLGYIHEISNYQIICIYIYISFFNSHYIFKERYIFLKKSTSLAPRRDTTHINFFRCFQSPKLSILLSFGEEFSRIKTFPFFGRLAHFWIELRQLSKLQHLPNISYRYKNLRLPRKKWQRECHFLFHFY